MSSSAQAQKNSPNLMTAAKPTFSTALVGSGPSTSYQLDGR
jgi:hypothetical protein